MRNFFWSSIAWIALVNLLILNGQIKFFPVALFLTARKVNIRQNWTITQPGLALILNWIYLCQRYLATGNTLFSRWPQKCYSIIPLLHTGKQTHTHTYILTLTHIPKLMWVASYPRSLLSSLLLSSRGTEKYKPAWALRWSDTVIKLHVHMLYLFCSLSVLYLAQCCA